MKKPVSKPSPMGERYHVLRRGTVVASTATEEQAIYMIRQYQAEELKAHQWLHDDFTYIKGTEIFVPYENGRS